MYIYRYICIGIYIHFKTYNERRNATLEGRKVALVGSALTNQQ